MTLADLLINYFTGRKIRKDFLDIENFGREYYLDFSDKIAKYATIFAGRYVPNILTIYGLASYMVSPNQNNSIKIVLTSEILRAMVSLVHFSNMQTFRRLKKEIIKSEEKNSSAEEFSRDDVLDYGGFDDDKEDF